MTCAAACGGDDAHWRQTLSAPRWRTALRAHHGIVRAPRRKSCIGEMAAAASKRRRRHQYQSA